MFEFNDRGELPARIGFFGFAFMLIGWGLIDIGFALWRAL